MVCTIHQLQASSTSVYISRSSVCVLCLIRRWPNCSSNSLLLLLLLKCDSFGEVLYYKLSLSQQRLCDMLLSLLSLSNKALFVWLVMLKIPPSLPPSFIGLTLHPAFIHTEDSPTKSAIVKSAMGRVCGKITFLPDCIKDTNIGRLGHFPQKTLSILLYNVQRKVENVLQYHVANIGFKSHPQEHLTLLFKKYITSLFYTGLYAITANIQYNIQHFS